MLRRHGIRGNRRLGGVGEGIADAGGVHSPLAFVGGLYGAFVDVAQDIPRRISFLKLLRGFFRDLVVVRVVLPDDVGDAIDHVRLRLEIRDAKARKYVFEARACGVVVEGRVLSWVDDWCRLSCWKSWHSQCAAVGVGAVAGSHSGRLLNRCRGCAGRLRDGEAG